MRRLWPDVIEATKQRRRVTWMHLTQNSQVVGVDTKTLTLGFANSGARDSFDSGGSAEIVRQAAIDVVGVDWRIETIIDPGADTGAARLLRRRPRSRTTVTRAGACRTRTYLSAASAPSAPSGPVAVAPEGPPAWAAPDETPPVRTATHSEPPSASSAREAIRQTRAPGEMSEAAPELVDADADASPDDLDADTELIGVDDLLARELGAQVIDEIPRT